jgi:pimeloyl-ACP methyl ester carboxylesterase
MVKEVAQNYSPAGAWFTDELKALHGIADKDVFAKEWVDAISAMVDAGGDISYHLAPNFRCPLLMMLGKQDTLNPIIYAEKFLQRIPSQGRLEIFECGHPVHKEAWKSFQKVVGDFLKNVAI